MIKANHDEFETFKPEHIAKKRKKTSKLGSKLEFLMVIAGIFLTP